MKIFLGLILGSLLAMNTHGLEPIVAGYTGEHSSQVLKQTRRYSVSLPERYYADARSYAVLYVIDADFQFQHVSALARSMARLGKIPAMIVVGVANNGPSDYVFSTTWAIASEPDYGGAAAYSQYLNTELIPLIDRYYRTNTDRALAGYSLGGLFSLYEWSQAQSSFNAFLAMSPSAWFDDERFKTTLENKLNNNTLPAPLFLTLANERDMGVTPLADLLAEKGKQPFYWQYKTYPNETHYTMALPALYDGLQFLTPNYFLDVKDLMAYADYEDVFAVFERKKAQWSGFSFSWLQAYTLAKYFYHSNQMDKVEEAMAKARKQFPASHGELVTQLSKALHKLDQPERTRALLLTVSDKQQQQADWMQQMSLTYTKESADAKRYHEKALLLARQHKLASWEVLELQP
ncbi:hypothetical protein R50072_08600 [Simiduia litorea]|uniref:alpha/beta hydrolase n=1 Tax=Simiduia litorea TaxID=1435348 RepID=UPI0036F2F29F